MHTCYIVPYNHASFTEDGYYDKFIDSNYMSKEKVDYINTLNKNYATFLYDTTDDPSFWAKCIFWHKMLTWSFCRETSRKFFKKGDHLFFVAIDKTTDWLVQIDKGYYYVGMGIIENITEWKDIIIKETMAKYPHNYNTDSYSSGHHWGDDSRFIEIRLIEEELARKYLLLCWENGKEVMKNQWIIPFLQEQYDRKNLFRISNGKEEAFKNKEIISLSASDGWNTYHPMIKMHLNNKDTDLLAKLLKSNILKTSLLSSI